MRLNSEAKISGAATALASVPSTMAVQAPVKAARSGSIWRQQYARVSLVEALGKRVRSPMRISSGEVKRAGRGKWCTRGARWTSDCVQAVSPAVSWWASVTSGAEIGPGHPGPPSDGTKRKNGRPGHDGGRDQPRACRARHHSCHV